MLNVGQCLLAAGLGNCQFGLGQFVRGDDFVKATFRIRRPQALSAIQFAFRLLKLRFQTPDFGCTQPFRRLGLAQLGFVELTVESCQNGPLSDANSDFDRLRCCGRIISKPDYGS